MIAHLEVSGITYDEFFQIYRQNIEFGHFHQQTIAPLITITEQEVKNMFYKMNAHNKALAFRYTLVDFSLPRKAFQSQGRRRQRQRHKLKNFRQVLINFQNNGVLPEDYPPLQTNVLGDITEDDLTPHSKSILKKTDEGEFSQPILIGDTYHVFFVKQKNVVESNVFAQIKDQIREKIYEKQLKRATNLWYKRQKAEHYIRYFL